MVVTRFDQLPNLDFLVDRSKAGNTIECFGSSLGYLLLPLVSRLLIDSLVVVIFFRIELLVLRPHYDEDQHLLGRQLLCFGT